jgi:hypothetical protein
MSLERRHFGFALARRSRAPIGALCYSGRAAGPFPISGLVTLFHFKPDIKARWDSSPSVPLGNGGVGGQEKPFLIHSAAIAIRPPGLQPH